MPMPIDGGREGLRLLRRRDPVVSRALPMAAHHRVRARAAAPGNPHKCVGRPAPPFDDNGTFTPKHLPFYSLL